MELLAYLGMADRAANFPARLSGGQQQRVAVARALANRPSVILADEPTAALDSQRGRQVLELFRKVAHEQNGAVIVVTHDHRALDVFDTEPLPPDHPLFDLDNVTITPHLAGSTVDSFRNSPKLMAGHLARMLQGEHDLPIVNGVRPSLRI